MQNVLQDNQEKKKKNKNNPLVYSFHPEVEK